MVRRPTVVVCKLGVDIIKGVTSVDIPMHIGK